MELGIELVCYVSMYIRVIEETVVYALNIGAITRASPSHTHNTNIFIYNRSLVIEFNIYPA